MPSHQADSIESLFSIYSNARDPSRLTLTGVIAFYSRLKLDVENDVMVLYIAYKMDCKCMYILTRDAVHVLEQAYNIHTFEELSLILPEWRAELHDREMFRAFYRYLFMYTVRSQSDCLKKRLHVDRAAHLWKLLFTGQFHLLDSFIAFVQSSRHALGIRQDEWNMFLVFLQQHGNDTEIQRTFDTNYAWPLLFCQYVNQI